MSLTHPIYERQEAETPVAWRAFQTYRDMGADRSVAKVARELGKTRQYMEQWSVKWQWVARADAWDAEQDRVVRESQIKAVRQMHERHATVASALLAKMARRISRLTDADLDRMTAEQVARTVEIAARLERVARGETESVVRTELTGAGGGPIDVVQMTPAARRQRLAELQEEIARRIGVEAPTAAPRETNVSTNGKGPHQ